MIQWNTYLSSLIFYVIVNQFDFILYWDAHPIIIYPILVAFLRVGFAANTTHYWSMKYYDIYYNLNGYKSIIIAINDNISYYN